MGSFEEDKDIIKQNLECVTERPDAVFGMVCTENVQYVLYRKNTENGREYGEAIDDDFIRIQRGNTAAYEEVQEKTLF